MFNWKGKTMPTRAMKRAAPSGLSAEAFGAFIADPERYERELAEFTKRKVEAEAAEKEARTALHALSERTAVLDRREEDLGARYTALAKQESAAADDTAEARERKAMVDAAASAVAAREAAVSAREDSLDQRRADAVAAVTALMA